MKIVGGEGHEDAKHFIWMAKCLIINSDHKKENKTINPQGFCESLSRKSSSTMS